MPRAGLELALRNWKEAERAAAAALAQNPSDEQAAADLAEAYRRQNRLDEALEVCATALERRPSPQLYLGRALVLCDLQQTEAAIAAVSSGLALIEERAEDAVSLFIASQLFELIGQRDLALGTAHRAVILNPREPRLMSHFGGLLIAVDPPLAEQRLRQSLGIDALQADALNNLGAALLAQKRLDEAAAAFRGALVLAPGFTLAKTNLTMVMIQKRRRSPVVPVGLFLCACSLWLTWTSFSISDSAAVVQWPRLAGAMGFLGLAIALSSLANWWAASRLARRDPELAALIRTVEADLSEGRIGYRQAIPMFRAIGHVLRGLGALVMIGASIGEIMVIRHFVKHRALDDLLGMALLLLGAGMGGLLLYEGRKLLTQAARQAADRG